jgi:hypothetical protein
MKFKIGDTLIHKYDKKRIDYMGIGYYTGIGNPNTDIHVIKFTLLKHNSMYHIKSVYNLGLYTDIFRELVEEINENGLRKNLK